MKLSRVQIETLSKYFADISKIIVASTVIGFFVPLESGPISLSIFISGFLIAIFALILSINLLEP